MYLRVPKLVFKWENEVRRWKNIFWNCLNHNLPYRPIVARKMSHYVWIDRIQLPLTPTFNFVLLPIISNYLDQPIKGLAIWLR